MNRNPIRGKLVLPTDCYDLASFEWSEVPATFAATPETISPVPKSLCETFGELVSAVRGYKHPANPLAAAFSK